MSVSAGFWKRQGNCSVLPDAVLKKVRFEIEEIDNLITAYEPLLNLAKTRNLDLIEKTALAQVLHYQVSVETENRGPVLKAETKESLLEYLGFRHVVRHIYSTNLDTDRMIHLAVKMKAVWESTKKDIVTFITSE